MPDSRTDGSLRPICHTSPCHRHLVWLATALPSPADPTSAASPASVSPVIPSFEWAVIGDSWSSGVAYSAGTVYSNLDYEFCYRSTEAWGAQMEADKTWTQSDQVFHFSACGGTLMNDIPRQMGISGNIGLALGTFGGNNAFFGDIARACIYQPRDGTNWGPAYDEDPDSTGLCKQNIQKSSTYIANRLAREFSVAIDDVFDAVRAQNQRPATFNLYVSSYAEFFNATTDSCDTWTFAPYGWLSKGKPKLVKELRSVMNSMVDNFNNVQANAVSNYPAVNLPGYHVRYVPISDVFESHRFCEDGHSFNDQFYSANVWLWNLQWFSGDQGADVVGAVSQTDDGVWFMQPPPGLVNGSYPATVLSLDTDDPTAADEDIIGQTQSGFGWTARPFHPKKIGNGAMAAAYIARFRANGVPGVAPAGATASGSDSSGSGLYCTDPSLEDGDGLCTCTQGGATTTVTPAGGPGNACPTSLNLGTTTTIATTVATSTAAPPPPPTTTATPSLYCSDPSLEDSDGLCTCNEGSVTTTVTPVGGPGNACPTVLALAKRSSLYCSDPSLEGSDGLCTSLDGGVVTTTTPAGGPGHACSTAPAGATPSLYCSNPSLEDGDGLCTCSQGSVIATITPAGGPGNTCPTVLP